MLFASTFLLLNLLVRLNTLEAYYTKDLLSWNETQHPENTELLELLMKIISLKHIQERNAFDEIVKNCPDQLKETQTCEGQISLDYAEARRHLFGQIYLDRKKLSIRDIYALHDFTQADFGSKPGPGINQIPFHEILNTEHTWPQSKFLKTGDGEIIRFQKGDLHHLFPAANDLNSYRGNYPFGET